VIITALVTVPVGSTATGVTNALTTALGSTSGASSFLGITVTSAPTFMSRLGGETIQAAYMSGYGRLGTFIVVHFIGERER
jgi:hypothetical protein